MNRKKFMMSFGLLATGAVVSKNTLGIISEAVTTPLLQLSCKLSAEQSRFSITYAVSRIDAMTPLQLERCLFETGISEPFNLNAGLAGLVEQGLLTQSVSANGLVYKLSDTSDTILNSDSRPGAGCLAEIDALLDSLKAQFEAEKDYIAQYTESSTGVVPVFLSIRDGARILLNVNLIVPDVATARIVTRNWMKNAHQTHQTVWKSIGEGLPFPDWKS